MKIRILDHTGDTEIDCETVEIAQEELTKFMDQCVREFKCEPRVWAKRADNNEMDLLENPRSGDISLYTEVLCQRTLLVGG